jgi:hypothetical protein
MGRWIEKNTDYGQNESKWTVVHRDFVKNAFMGRSSDRAHEMTAQ